MCTQGVQNTRQHATRINTQRLPDSLSSVVANPNLFSALVSLAIDVTQRRQQLNTRHLLLPRPPLILIVSDLASCAFELPPCRVQRVGNKSPPPCRPRLPYLPPRSQPTSGCRARGPCCLKSLISGEIHRTSSTIAPGPALANPHHVRHATYQQQHGAGLALRLVAAGHLPCLDLLIPWLRSRSGLGKRPVVCPTSGAVHGRSDGPPRACSSTPWRL